MRRPKGNMLVDAHTHIDQYRDDLESALDEIRTGQIINGKRQNVHKITIDFDLSSAALCVFSANLCDTTLQRVK